MSVRASSWAWEHSASTGSAFLVLLALADHAGVDHGDAWPSVRRLAERCRVDERTVQRALDRLIELGEVVLVDPATGEEVTDREATGGRGQTNRYRLTFRTGDATASGETVGGGPPGNLPPPNRKTPASAPETPASTRRNPGTTPPEPSGTVSGTARRRSFTDPDAERARARELQLEREARRRRGEACPDCDDRGVVLDGDVARPCPCTAAA